ncbi:MAG: hypothetical protein J4F48_13865 [Nitrospinae bacterium]|nr:hypothetical protein [Nitrospinota bacterium]
MSVQDVRRIVERLLPHVEEEGHREVNQLLNSGPYDQERHEKLNLERERAFQISVTIYGRDGESLFGYGTEPFDSPNIPTPIESIYISNSSAYQNVTGHNPLNNFTLHLDFSTPPLVDNNNPVSNPTPNFSNFTVEGKREAWVASIHQAVMEVLGKKSNGRNFMHAAFVYDIGLGLLGFPVAIYLCWRFSGFVETYLGVLNPFIAVVAYIYIFFFVLNVYRVLFGYTKWAFPAVELTDNENRAKVHRRFWCTILIGLFVSAIYDLLTIP